MRHHNEILTPWGTCEDVARHLKVAAGTVRNWAAAGIIPCHRFRRVLRFDLMEVEDWVRSGAVSSLSPKIVQGEHS